MQNIYSYSVEIKKLEYMNMYYLEIPTKCIEFFGGKFHKRLVCRVNNQISFQCGIVSLGNGLGYVSINIKRMKELKVKLGDSVSVVLEEDQSELGMEMCEEMIEVFAQDEFAFQKFNKLTDGKKRTLIHWVATVKNSDKRIERSLKVARILIGLPDGVVDYKLIYQK